MKCKIQWVNSQTGCTTPDDNDAVALAQAFDPRVPGTDKWEWIINTPFVLVDRVKQYTVDANAVMTEEGWSLPICAKHIRKMPFWRYFALPGQSKEDAHILVREQPPAIVLENVINAFPNEATRILRELRYSALSDYWSFNLCGMYVGVERDGYIHS
jgi:hypothetical protein